MRIWEVGQAWALILIRDLGKSLKALSPSSHLPDGRLTSAIKCYHHRASLSPRHLPDLLLSMLLHYFN